MKRLDYRPIEFRTMDPSFRYNMWRLEKMGGHLYADSRRIATFHSAVSALFIGGVFGLFVMIKRNSEKEVDKLLSYGPDGDKVNKPSK